MRVALCISGLYTTFDLWFPKLIEKLLLNYAFDKIDIYISTWDEAVKGLAEEYATEYKANIPLNSLREYKKKYEKLYPHLKIIFDIEPFDISIKVMNAYSDELKIQKNIRAKKQIELISMWYKIQRAFSLVDTAIHYDAFVRMRCDSYFCNFPFECIKKSKKPQLYLSPYIWEDPHFESSKINKLLNDQVWMSNDYNVMSRTCNLFQYLRIVWNDDTYGEQLFYKLIEHSKLLNNVEWVFFEHVVHRMNGHKQLNGKMPIKSNKT